MAANGRLDDVDHLLIEELQRDARLSLAELGRRVGLTPPAVADRLRKLDDEGTITGYTARVDPRALGYALTAIVRIRPAPRMIAKVADLARATPEVVECLRVTGEDCFIMRVHLRSIDDLSGLLDRFLVFGETTTSLVAAVPIPLRAPPI